MVLQLDHVFVCCRRGLPDPVLLLAPLLARGVRIGRSRRHAGQGTANHCVFFADAMLELLWIEDEARARGAAAAPLRLADRADWLRTGASPFGICLRRVGREGAGAGAADDPLPFAAWEHAPAYLPPGVRFQVAACDDVRVPLVFASNAPWAPPSVPHALAGARVTACRVATTGDVPPHLQACVAPVQILHGDEPLLDLELEVDGGTGVGDDGADLRPALPLRVRWHVRPDRSTDPDAGRRAGERAAAGATAPPAYGGAMSEPEIPARAPCVMQVQPGFYAWCACGRSKKQPFCDGSHAGTRFVPMIEEITEARTVAWCCCKRSARKPFCDGSHDRLPR